MADPRKWKSFERLVAAIHKFTDEGAEVNWNETIHGRQFDVTVRFDKGLYRYLTVIECKDYSGSVPVGDVEAFVTKSRDAKADRAVMASSAGFQSGARDVAARHNITLIRVSESEDVDLSLFGARWGENTEVLHIKSIELEYVDGERKALSAQSHEMTYYVNKIVIEHNGSQESLAAFFDRYARNFAVGDRDTYEEHRLDLPTGTAVVAPGDEELPLKPLVCIHVLAGVTTARTLQGPVMFDPYLLTPNIRVEDVTSGQAQSFSPQDLALGVDTVFEEGKFYESPQLASYYYCDKIEVTRAQFYLVESYQHGILIQAHLVIETRFANRYIEVTDETVLRRLRRRLRNLKASDKPPRRK